MTDTAEYENALAMVRQALCLAGQDRRQLGLQAEADKIRITTKTRIPKQEFLFTMQGKPCFPRGELVAISGKAKTGKTFFASALMALCFRNEVLGIKRRVQREMKVLWFDTEQSAETTQDILCNRLIPMISADDGAHATLGYNSLGDGACSVSTGGCDAMEEAIDAIEERFEIYNARQIPWQERQPMFEAVVRRARPDLVVLDGIRDFMDDINDGKQSKEIMDALLRLASDTGSCIVCILHQNKGMDDKNLRGCIGTELKNKAFEAYECGKSEDRVFSVRQSDTRKYDIPEKLLYVVGQDGIPHQQGEWEAERVRVQQPAVGTRGRASQSEISCPQSPEETERVMTAFRSAFRANQKTKTFRALYGAVMHIAHLGDYHEFKDWLNVALERGVIRRTENGEFEPCMQPP